MTAMHLIGLAIQLSMALIIFCVALNASFGDVLFLWRRPSLLVRSLVSMLVVMPVFVLALALWFDLNHAVMVALLASAMSPVPPILPNKQIKAGGEQSYVVGLLTTTALVSIAYVPLVAALLGDAFQRPLDVSIANIVRIVATSMLCRCCWAWRCIAGHPRWPGASSARCRSWPPWCWWRLACRSCSRSGPRCSA